MNRGLYGIRDAQGVGNLICFKTRPTSPLLATGTMRTAKHPFGSLVLAQYVLLNKVAQGGYRPGDYVYMPGIKQDSTVNTTGQGFTRCDGFGLEFQLGAPDVQIQDISTTVLLTATPASWYELFGVIGNSSFATPSGQHYKAAHRWRTPIKPWAAGTLYSEVNRLVAAPAICWPKWVCLSPDAGYFPGDEIDAASNQANASGAIDLIIRANERVVDFRTGVVSSAVIPHGQTGAITAMTAGKWGVYLEVIG